MADVHVLPVNDWVEHQHATGTECACGPTTEPVPRDDGSMDWMVVHHALDGREARE